MNLTVVMTPPSGHHIARYVGERLQVTAVCPKAAAVYLRTDLAARSPGPIGDQGACRRLAGWRDVPLRWSKDGSWTVELPLTAVGHFRFTTYAVDEKGLQYWADGQDAGISVHPAWCRSGNSIYCAFPRLFGSTRHLSGTVNALLDEQAAVFDRHGYTVIPPSGTLRDLIRAVPHIFGELGFGILHLLPINPTPTTFARFGRFGSPYAATDFTAIDPALVEFDKRTTAQDQFDELTAAIHGHGGRLILDLAINHTGWGSRLQNDHPEWFKRANGHFVSPGAWGVTWEDLVELDHEHHALWDHLAEVFLCWCRRGVDGFRCDAGYMVPLAAWRDIIRCVRQEFPDTVFLLEGLGGGWEATEALLCDGGMQWAYSELFQNFTGEEVASYLGHARETGETSGVLVHYAETHDNDRLAAKGRAWSLMRNGLCALTSQRGGYGITCGVEWLADEKIDVHRATGLRWGASDNIVAEIRRLNELLADHPCFLDGATITELPQRSRQVYVLDRRRGEHRVLVCINLHHDRAQTLALPDDGQGLRLDLLSGTPLPDSNKIPAQTVWCLAAETWQADGRGTAEDREHQQVAWAYGLLASVLPLEGIGPIPDADLAALVHTSAFDFCAALHHLDERLARTDLGHAIHAAIRLANYPQVTEWDTGQANRVTVVPRNHLLLVRHPQPFRLELRCGAQRIHRRGISAAEGYLTALSPDLEVTDLTGPATMQLTFVVKERHHTVAAELLFAGAQAGDTGAAPPEIALITNGRGGMAHLPVDFGRVRSKYDCVLGANLAAAVPVDRHVLIKRLRVWIHANGFITELSRDCLGHFAMEGGVAHWRFRIGAGGGASVPVSCQLYMPEGRNATEAHFRCDSNPQGWPLKVVIRTDLEDRSFHAETQLNESALNHFRNATVTEDTGFSFASGQGCVLRVAFIDGIFQVGEECLRNIPHPFEATRGQVDRGDAWSPGWFEAPLITGEDRVLVCAVDEDAPVPKAKAKAKTKAKGQAANADGFIARLRDAVRAYVVRRDDGKTVIAGYPWFLDWGRDTLICARGILAAGDHDTVRDLLRVFGRFEQGGTLPNSINGADASDRDTVDAPLWYALVAEEFAAATGEDLPDIAVDAQRSVADVLVAIACGYRDGTRNGIHVDPDSGLVWSPAHFTWMDTNHPAGSPRQGYPVEIQALWIRLLRHLAMTDTATWESLRQRAEASFAERFWLEQQGYLADLLAGDAGVPAAAALVDDALRSNVVLPIALGVVGGDRAKRTVLMAIRHLVVPGALRSLAPLRLGLPLTVKGAHGKILLDAHFPYQGRYEGDEDTRRKPAYHNGTAWTWTFPALCEAIVAAWPDDYGAREAARGYLGTMRRLLDEGCAGHLPEILDGDAPHQQRGCDAQSWGATEALRVALLLGMD